MAFGLSRLPIFLVGVLYIGIALGQNYDDEKIEDAIRIIEHIGETRKGLGALRRVIDGINNDLRQTQKRTCSLGGGMSHHCAAALLDSQLGAADWLKSGYSPGKRSNSLLGSTDLSRKDGLSSAAVRKVKDLSWKRKGLDVMKRMVEQMDADLITEQKRTCLLNLGGHCATESAASLADHWHYLNSHLSPGRKRRDTRLFQKLINGQILE